jgi:aspartate kinase
VGLVVQKYGGSSVADAEASSASRGGSSTPKGRPRRLRRGLAMGDTTDELIDLAEQVTPLPPARELDMLLTAGERISMACSAWRSPPSARRRGRSPAARPA